MTVTVLVADDHPIYREGIVRAINDRAELELVGEAADGEQAVELVRRHRPDVVLMDIRMPVLDGIEATRRIKREFPGIPVLVMNTFGGPDQLLEALEAGAAGYVLKRSGPQQIRDAVRGALIGEYPLDEEMTMRLLGRLADEAPNLSSS